MVLTKSLMTEALHHTVKIARNRDAACMWKRMVPSSFNGFVSILKLAAVEKGGY
jgi:hypothetical protein